MLNGTTGAAGVCCQMPNPSGGGSYGASLPGGSITVGGVQIPRTAKGLLQQIGAALDSAIHGGDSGLSLLNSGGGFDGNTHYMDPVEFPMVDPFKLVVQTRSPVTALTAFPNRFTYKVPSVAGQEPDDEQSADGFSGLGFIAPESDGWPTGIALPSSSGPSTLQSILGTIQATLPATIGALRAAPTNIYSGGYQNPYAPGAGQIYGTGGVTQGGVANIGAQAGAAVGNIGDTFGNIVAQHPYLVLAAGAAAVLLFMNPPKRR